jgi:hypothetical protein
MLKTQDILEALFLNSSCVTYTGKLHKGEVGRSGNFKEKFLIRKIKLPSKLGERQGVKTEAGVYISVNPGK